MSVAGWRNVKVLNSQQKMFSNVWNFEPKTVFVLILVLASFATALALSSPEILRDRLDLGQQQSLGGVAVQPLRAQEASVVVTVRSGSAEYPGTESLDFGGVKLLISSKNLAVQVADGFGQFENAALFPGCVSCTVTLGPGASYLVAWQDNTQASREGRLPEGQNFGDLFTKFPKIQQTLDVSVIVDFGVGKINQPQWRSVVSGFFVLVALLVAFSFVGGFRPTLVTLRQHSILHIFIAVSQVFGAVVLPSQSDEGWVQARSESALSRGFFGNIYSVNDAAHPQGVLLEGVFATILSLGGGQAHLRLLIAVFSVLTWFVIYATLRELFAAFGIRGFSGILVAAASYFTLSVSWMINVRSEPFVALMFSLVVLSIVRLAMSRQLENLILIGTAGALALSTHQSATVLLVPLVGALVLFASSGHWTFRDQTLTRREAFIITGLAVLYAGILLLFLTTSLYGLSFFLDEFSTWWSEASHAKRGELAAELDRLSNVLERRQGGVLILTGITTLMLVVVRHLSRPNMKASLGLVLLAVALAPLGLVLTGSKWDWHYAVLVVPASLGLGLASATLFEKFRPEFQPSSNSRLRLALTTALLAGSLTYALFALNWVHRRPDVAPFSEFRVLEDALYYLTSNSSLAALGFLDITASRVSVIAICLVGTVAGILAFVGAHRGQVALISVLVLLPGILLLSVYGGSSSYAFREGQWNEATARIAELAGDDDYGCTRYRESLIVSGIVELTSGETLSLEGVRKSSRMVAGEGALSPELARFQTGTEFVGVWVFDPENNLKALRTEGLGRFAPQAPWASKNEGWELHAATAEEVAGSAIRFEADGPILVAGPFGLRVENPEVQLRDEQLFAGPKHYQFSGCEKNFPIDGSFVSGPKYRTEKVLPPERSGIDWFQVTLHPTWFNTVFQVAN